MPIFAEIGFLHPFLWVIMATQANQVTEGFYSLCATR